MKIRYLRMGAITAMLVYTLIVSGCTESPKPVSQPGSSKPEPPKMKMTTVVPPGIASPDKVETRLGTLRFFDGFPDNASVEKLYDNLDFQRAVQAYLLAIAAGKHGRASRRIDQVGARQFYNSDLRNADGLPFAVSDGQRKHSVHVDVDQRPRRPAGRGGSTQCAGHDR